MTKFFSAIYSDGTKFTYSEDGVGKGDYGKIDRSKLVQFEVYDNDKILHRLHIEKNQRLILRRRVMKSWGTKWNPDWKEGDDPKEKLLAFEKVEIIYLVGWQETVNGVNRQAITILHEDGHTELISEWKPEPLSQPIFTAEESQVA